MICEEGRDTHTIKAIVCCLLKQIQKMFRWFWYLQPNKNEQKKGIASNSHIVKKSITNNYDIEVNGKQFKTRILNWWRAAKTWHEAITIQSISKVLYIDENWKWNKAKTT